MCNRTDNPITINSGSIVEKFKVAASVFAQSGLSIPISKIIEAMILSELNRLDPNEMAERFSHTVGRKLLKVSDQTAERDKNPIDQPASLKVKIDTN